MPKEDSQPIYQRVLRKALLLGYGSIIHRHCAENAECRDDDIQVNFLQSFYIKLHSNATIIISIFFIFPQRLQKYFDKAYAEKNIDELVLLVKVMANAGHRWSFKSITKLLPIHGTAGATLPRKVHIEAIMALRSIANQKPKEVTHR